MGILYYQKYILMTSISIHSINENLRELWIGSKYKLTNDRQIGATNLWTDGTFLNESGEISSMKNFELSKSNKQL